MKLEKSRERGPIQTKTKAKRGVQFVPTYFVRTGAFVSSTSLVFNFGCSFSLVTAKGGQKCDKKRSVTDLNTDSSYLLVSPGLVSSSKRSPRTRRGARRGGGEAEAEGGGEGEDEGEDGDGWGGSCWRTPPPGDSLLCHLAPVEAKQKKKKKT